MEMEDISIIDWILKYEIKNEKGEPIEFTSHLFLWDIYLDQSQYLCVKKPAQVGLSTLEILKNFYDAKQYKMDIIYTLPTDADVNVFVGGKVNRIIAQNPILLEYTKDKDSVEQKQIGDSMIYFRGTFTEKAAIMVTADRLVHDEKDSSKQSVVKDYEARTQHSKYKQKHVFSHPSTPNSGVDVEWQDSDQKEWFIECPHCHVHQYLSWDLSKKENMSVDIDRQIFVCKKCGGELSDKDRAIGQWIPRVFRDKDGNVMPRKYSGYHISLLMAPWITAKEIISKYRDPEITEEFFYNKILGLEYIGGGNKLTHGHLMQNITPESTIPSVDDVVVLGVDTGLRLDYVVGGKHGLFFHGDAEGYAELDRIMQRWPKAIAIVDAGGDLIGSRQFQNKWKGRVYLCYFGNSKLTSDKPSWNYEEFIVNVDRNKYIQLVVDEFRNRLIPLQGTETDWYEYWLDWNNLSRTKIVDPVTGQFKTYKWVRSGRDHRALATVYWRVGIDRFMDEAVSFFDPTMKVGQNGLEPDLNDEVTFFPKMRGLFQQSQ